MNNYQKNGFTLIELLTVIAIIGILAGILIPTVGAVKTSANKSKTKVQFSQWAVAMQLFKSDYGFYPDIGSSNKVAPDKFAAELTGKKLDGTAASPTGNTKKLSYYSISSNELDDPTTPTKLVDAFGNTDIAVFVDSNGDGMIDSNDSPKLDKPAVASIDGVSITPTSTQIPSSIRAGVIFYSAGKGSSTTATSDLVFSWQ